jgi:hypothetical protein
MADAILKLAASGTYRTIPVFFDRIAPAGLPGE